MLNLRRQALGNQLYETKEFSYFGAVKTGVLNLVENKDFGRVLDIGGGDGATSKYVVNNGLAISSSVLEPYAEFSSSDGVSFIRGSAEDPAIYEEFKRNGKQFDTLFCFDVLEHLYDPWKALKAASNVQSSVGRLIVSMPNARFVALTVPLVLFGRFNYKASGIMDHTHIRWFTRSSTIELVESAGYKIEKISGFIEPRVRIINSLTFGIFRRFFEYQYIIEARKISD